LHIKSITWKRKSILNLKLNNKIRTMKKIILFIAFVVFANVSFGQAWLENLPKTKSSKDLTFFDYQKAFNSYYDYQNVKNGKVLKEGKLIKVPGWKQFKRWEYYMESRINNTTGEFPTTTTAIEMQKNKSESSDFKSSGAWTNLGTNSSDGGYYGIGRINCISFHPSDINTFWVGAPSGGIWKTTNGGNSWTAQSDNYGNSAIGVSAIAVSPNFASDNTLYIATGDRDGGSSWTLSGGNSNDNNSVGVLKSTDGGTTWAATGLTESVSNRRTINALLIDPNNSLILYAALYNGVWKTSNGGTNWSQVYTSSYKIIDMEFKPGTSSTIYACTEDYWNSPIITTSINSGTSWTTAVIGASSFADTDYRIELAVGGSGANTAYVYAAVANRDGGLTGIYQSSDNGTNFIQTFDGSTKSLFGYYSDGSGSNTGQGSYDIALAVKPDDVNTLFVGGINTWKSTDGGVNWTNNNMWTSSATYNSTSSPVVHADQHCLKYQSASTLFEGNDGGIYKTTDGGISWTDKSNGLVISQIYRIGVSQNTSGTVINGLQDNGSKLLSSSTWVDVKGGDGMECIIDYTTDNVQYGTYVNGQITRTTNGWTNWTEDVDINENIGDGTLEGAWVSPYIIDPDDHNTLYVGYADVWKTTDKGDNFTKISTMNSSGNLRSMAIAPSDNQTLYVADQSMIWVTVNGGTNWTDVTGTLPTGTNNITYIAVHATKPQTVWLTMGGYNSSKVYESIDGGSSWTNISDGLPSIPVFTIVHDKEITSKDILYLGTDVGVYCKNGTENWAAFSTGLPNVMVTELEIYYAADHSNSKLKAATFGRGLWETPVEQVSSDLATVTTTTVTNITTNSATSGGNVTDIGTSNVTERGVVYSTTSNPTTSDTKIVDGSIGTGTYSSSLTGLSASTTYHVRAYATNSAGTAYGANVEFATTCGVITTFPLTENFESGALPDCWTYDGTAWTYANGGNSGNPASAHGGSYNALFYHSSYTVDVSKLITPQMDFTGISNAVLTFWHTQAVWTSDQDQLRVYYKTSSGGSWTLLNEYTSSITEWTEETITLPNLSTDYYVAFEATGQYGYGVTIDDITIDNGNAADLATVTTTVVTDITTNSATSGGNVTNEGSVAVTERGIVWSTSANPTISDTKVIDGSTGIGTFTSSITGLSESTTYYVRAYATNSTGTAYGVDKEFTTSSGLATVTTTVVTDVTTNSATSGGNITNEGSSTVTERGIVWSTSANPTISDTKVIDGSTGTGTFTSSITGLSESTTYYVRAYATNSTGTAYGVDKEFTTSSGLATVTTTVVTDITTNSATSGGNVTNEGSSAVTERGIVWSTSVNPTISDTKVIDGSTGIGTFTSSITGLSESTTYYVRSYAINTQGTAYGADEEFTTITTSLMDLKVMGINIYPNPTNGVIHISSDKNINKADIKIVDLSGKIVFSKTYKNLMKEIIDLSHLSKNVYIIKLKTEDKLINSKIVIE
jgi:photosystem II stability/assembly factor-like uncharacterized protein